MPPLHGILPLHGLTLCYIYVYTISISADVTISAKTITASKIYPVTHHLSDASTVIGMIIFALLHFPDLTHRSQFNSDILI